MVHICVPPMGIGLCWGGDSSDIYCRGCIVMHLGRGLGAVWVVLAVLFTPEGVLACTLVVGCVPLGLVGWR